LDDRGSIPGTGRFFFLFSTKSTSAVRPTYLLNNKQRSYFLSVRRGGSSADYSPPHCPESEEQDLHSPCAFTA